MAIYIPTLAGGGAEQSMLRLAEAFVDHGCAVDLVVNRNTGSYADRVPAGMRICELARHRKARARLDVLRAYPGDLDVALRPILLARKPVMTLPYLPGLVDYLSRERPTVLISALSYANLLALWARRLAGVSTRTMVSEHNTLSREITQRDSRRSARARWQYLAPLVGRVCASACAGRRTNSAWATTCVCMDGPTIPMPACGARACSCCPRSGKGSAMY